MKRLIPWTMVAVFLMTSVASAEPPERIEFGAATQADLVKVKGIGKKTAEKILAYRDAHAPIKRMGQLLEVKGIGKTTLQRLTCFFFVEAEGKLPCEIATIRHGVGPVNINTATGKELETLPNIGKKRAEKIIKDRTENGLFHSVDDLQRIKGIGRGMVGKLKDLVVVRLDINSARSAEFEAMGFANGDDIVKFRGENGSFGSVEDLKKVPGIDAGLVDRLMDFLRTR